MANPDIKRSEQRILNLVHDEEYNALVVENGGYDGTRLVRPVSDQVATIIDDSADPIIYIGKAPIGSATSSAVWQIVRLDTTSGLVKTWADGNANFDSIWDNRASLTYQ